MLYNCSAATSYGMNLIKEAVRNEQSKSAYIVNDTIAVIILVSISAIILESVQVLKETYGPIFAIAGIVFTSIFAVEYAIRLFFAHNRIKYAFSPLGIIDFLAFFPGLLALVLPAFIFLQPLRVLRVVRILRLLRLFRILKLIAYDNRKKKGGGMGIIDNIRAVDIEIYLLTLLSVVIISGTLMYLAESSIPGTPFINIPESMWWAIVTVTTVGSGDLVPVTVLGKIIAALTMISGLTLFALLITVIGKSAQIVLFGSPLDEEEKLKKLASRSSRSTKGAQNTDESRTK